MPFVAFVRRNPSIARVVAISQTGRERVEQIRSHFASFLSAEQALGAARDARARRTAHAAILAASIALAAALTFLIGAAAYLVRAVARPVRLAAAVAERVAAGDLTGRLPTEGPGEVGQLERSFNTMADSLQRNRDDLEERNRRLVESERLKTELVSNVSHELRTPLASVLGFSDLLLKRDVDPEDQRRYLEVIRTEAARLATLLNDLLDLQRHEQGVIELRREEFDLNQLLSVQVAFDPTEERLVVYGDPDRLAQVIGNLLSNAIKYSPDGGRIQVTTGVSEGEAWIWVRDPGLGIPSGHQHQVFTKFFRGEAARKRGIAGTGLGLVLARQIVEAHEGQIGFESEDRKGSTFWVRLPAVVDRSALAAGDETQSRHGT